MTKDGWRELIISAAQDESRLDKLALLLEQYDQAQQALRDIGYGWTGAGILAVVEQIAQDLSKYRNVEPGKVSYEYCDACMAIVCACGNRLTFSEGGDVRTCACGQIYRMVHYLEVAPNA